MKWWQNTIVYELYPNSFKDSDGDGYGDLKGITSELDHLKSLGVGAIWLTPVYVSPMGDNGYDVADYYSINPRYGTMEDMDELIKEAKKREIRIVMDLVFNHTSNECEWFKESASSRDNDKSDWYIWADPKEDGSVPNNWRGVFGGSVWTYCETRGQYYLHTFGDFQPDVNWENPKVRNALYDIANFWINKGVGGFRLDAITYIKKPADMSDGPVDAPDNMVSVHSMTANTDGILDFLHEFKDQVQVGKDIFVVGEANGVPASELPLWVGENGVFDMIFEFSHVNVQFSGGEVWYNTKDWKLTELKKCFSDSQKATKDKDNGWYPVFLENHDQPRSINHFLPADADPVQGAKVLGMLMMTLRGTPFMYEGQEIGMTNIDWDNIKDYDDISSHNQFQMAKLNGLTTKQAMECVKRFSRDNSRTPMQWTDGENAGFTDGTPWLPVNSNYKTVNVASENENSGSVLCFYHQLKTLRDEHEVLKDGNYTELFQNSEKIYAYCRENAKEKIIILLNFTGEAVEVKMDDLGIESQTGFRILLSNCEGERASEVSKQTEKVNLYPYEAMCLQVD